MNDKCKKLYSYEQIETDVIIQNHKIVEYPYDSLLKKEEEENQLIEGCTYKNIKVSNFGNELGNIKCANKFVYPDASKKKEKSVDLFTRELYFLCHLKNLHPNIVEIYGWAESPTHPRKIISMEYVKHSSLTVMLKQGKFNFNGTEKTKIALGVAHTINYLHKLGIHHCDLSLNNILIDENNEPKICDFGNAKYSSESPNHIGTPGYAAPEIRFHTGYKENSPQSDVFGFGAILWVLATEESLPPMKPNKDNLTYDKFKDENLKNIKLFIKSCRACHPRQRYTFDNIIKLIVYGKYVFPDTDFEKVIDYYDRLEMETKDISEFEP